MPSTIPTTHKLQQPGKQKAKTKGTTKKCSKKQEQNSSVGVSSKQGKDIWIPKNLLRAQGYYEGQTQIWVPKPCQQKPFQAKTIVKTYWPKPKVHQPQKPQLQWRPKRKVATATLVPPMQQTMKWIPKIPHQ